MKTKITIILLLCVITLTAQDSATVHYNLSVVDLAIKNSNIFPFLECDNPNEPKNNEPKNVKRKRKKVKKDTEITRRLDDIIRGEGFQSHRKSLFHNIRHIHWYFEGRLSPLDLGFRMNHTDYLPNGVTLIAETSLYLWMDGGYYTYLFYDKKNEEETANPNGGFYVHLLSKYPIFCASEDVFINLFDIAYFRDYIVPHISKKINIIKLSHQELVFECVYD